MSTPAEFRAAAVLTGRKRWVALAFLALGVSMIILDATVVNVAIPTMVKDLGLTTSDAEWVSAAYSLTFASLLILSGRIADRSGRKLMFILGVIVFVAASVLVAASDSSSTLIAARALQGVGGAMILPSSLSVINAVFVGKDRAIAFAVWGGTIGGMAALGPLVGGWLTTHASWHWAFLINVPIGIIVLVGVLMTVPETKELGGPKGFDILGTILITTGLFGLVFALIEGQRYGWTTPTGTFSAAGWTWPSTTISIVAVAAFLAVIAIAAFVALELHRVKGGNVVVVDLRLFRIRTFGAGNVVALVVSLGEFGLLFALPLFLQATRGYDALQTGVILLALAVTAALILPADLAARRTEKRPPGQGRHGLYLSCEGWTQVLCGFESRCETGDGPHGEIGRHSLTEAPGETRGLSVSTRSARRARRCRPGTGRRRRFCGWVRGHRGGVRIPTRWGCSG